jgi:hypothetical protein
VTAGGIFDLVQRRAQAEELTERLRHPPPPLPAAVPGAGVWTVKRLQATFPWLAGYRSLSGVWRAVRRRGPQLLSQVGDGGLEGGDLGAQAPHQLGQVGDLVTLRQHHPDHLIATGTLQVQHGGGLRHPLKSEQVR